MRRSWLPTLPSLRSENRHSFPGCCPALWANASELATPLLHFTRKKFPHIDYSGLQDFVLSSSQGSSPLSIYTRIIVF